MGDRLGWWWGRGVAVGVMVGVRLEWWISE